MRSTTTTTTVAVFVAPLLLIAQPARAANPEDAGPYAVTKSAHTEQLAGQSVAFDLYRPQQLAAPAPLVVLGHGFQRKKENMAGWGEALAQRGYIAAAPNFPGLLPDHALNGKVVVALLAWLVARGGDAQSPLHGLVDGSRQGALGHSAGGLAAFLAAADDPGIDVVVGLDPVDASDLGKNRAPAVKASSTIIRASPGACNAQGNAEGIYQALVAPRLTLRVKGGNHCDGELPSDALCGVFCGGGADPARQALFLRYALATIDYVLRCEAQMKPWLGGPSAQGDVGIEDLRSAGFPPPQLGCGVSPADGGPTDGGPTDGAQEGSSPPADGASLPDTGDGSSAGDGGTEPPRPADGAAGAADGAVSGEGSGCGCVAAGPPAFDGSWLLLLCGLAGALRLSRLVQR